MTQPLTRRRFLQGASALGAAVAVGACVDHAGQRPVAATTSTSASPGTNGVLVVVTLYGGNDALNTVVPVNDPIYRAQRGSLALDPAATHDIGEGYALHPALTRCKGLWDAGRLAVVHGVGFPGLDRSHFHCMDVWNAGSEDDTSSGWIGRWLDAAGTGPIDAIAVGRGVPLLGRGRRRSAAAVPPGPFALPGDDSLHALLTRLAADDHGRSPLGDLVASSTADLLSVSSTVTPVVASTAPAETLASRLDTVATMINADLHTRVYAVDLGSFDTHANQAATHQALLGEVDTALGSFLDQVGDRPVTVLVYSEFGRRVVPNASAGTDHGRAGTVLLAGTVRPGHHGEPPPLDRLSDGDLTTTVDFRAVYGGVLEGVLGIKASDVLDRPPAPLLLV
ncbi:MAG: DUF1501 domain-containing protein [Acidimicrobiales bacterium]